MTITTLGSFPTRETVLVSLSDKGTCLDACEILHRCSIFSTLRLHQKYVSILYKVEVCDPDMPSLSFVVCLRSLKHCQKLNDSGKLPDVVIVNVNT